MFHWIALTECSQMSSICRGFSNFRFFASFCFGQFNHQQHSIDIVSFCELIDRFKNNIFETNGIILIFKLYKFNVIKLLCHKTIKKILKAYIYI